MEKNGKRKQIYLSHKILMLFKPIPYALVGMVSNVISPNKIHSLQCAVRKLCEILDFYTSMDF